MICPVFSVSRYSVRRLSGFTAYRTWPPRFVSDPLQMHKAWNTLTYLFDIVHARHQLARLHEPDHVALERLGFGAAVGGDAKRPCHPRELDVLERLKVLHVRAILDRFEESGRLGVDVEVVCWAPLPTGMSVRARSRVSQAHPMRCDAKTDLVCFEQLQHRRVPRAHKRLDNLPRPGRAAMVHRVPDVRTLENERFQLRTRQGRERRERGIHCDIRERKDLSGR